MKRSDVRAWPEAGSVRGIRREREPHASLASGVAPPEWAKGAVLYCVYPRAFSPDGRLDAVRARLGELKALGADALWIMPIHKVGEKGRKGRLGSPYAIRDYLSIDPLYGTEADFRDLVSSAHAEGLRVILDLVLNHASLDHPAPSPDWFHRDPLGRRTRRVGDWSDVADWNYDVRAVRDHLLSAIEHWVSAAGIDGYRCDVAGMVPADFWSEARERLLRLKPDHFMLAEWDDPAVHESAFHGTYDWELYRRMLAAVQGRTPCADLAPLVERRHADFPSNGQPLRFVENHDEPRVRRRFGSAAWAVTKFVALAGGLFLVYNGQEVGARHRPDLFDRDPIDWDLAGSAREREALRSLLSFRRELRGLGPPAAIPSGPGRSIAAYTRKGDGRSLVVAMNLSGHFAPIAAELRDITYSLRPWGFAEPKLPPDRIPPRTTIVWTSN